jgi:hypothetical protein
VIRYQAGSRRQSGLQGEALLRQMLWLYPAWGAVTLWILGAMWWVGYPDLAAALWPVAVLGAKIMACALACHVGLLWIAWWGRQ